MTEHQATLVLLVVAVLLIPLGVWVLATAKRSRRAMAPLAGMIMLLGAFFTADPPPPPPAESATPRPGEEDENAEPKA